MCDVPREMPRPGGRGGLGNGDLRARASRKPKSTTSIVLVQHSKATITKMWILISELMGIFSL